MELERVVRVDPTVSGAYLPPANLLVFPLAIIFVLGINPVVEDVHGGTERVNNRIQRLCESKGWASKRHQKRS